MKIEGIQKVEVNITHQQLAQALQQFIIEYYTGSVDDAGCDWTTTKDRKFCIGQNVDLVISDDPIVADLVDAVNIIKCGKKIHVEDEVFNCPDCGNRLTTGIDRYSTPWFEGGRIIDIDCEDFFAFCNRCGWDLTKL